MLCFQWWQWYVAISCTSASQEDFETCGEQKFFVLTAVEAHAAKLKYHQDKQRKEQEKGQKKRQQELKWQEKESAELIKNE